MEFLCSQCGACCRRAGIWEGAKYGLPIKKDGSCGHLKNNLCSIYEDQVFGYKKNDEWKALDGYCFVKPIKPYNKFAIEKEEPLMGVVKYTDGSFKKEELIGFTPDSEYEFIIDNQRLYRVMTKEITIKYEYKGKEEEYNPSWV